VIVAQMLTRTEAIAAMTDVAGQGEAPELGLHNVEASHFDRFLEVYQEFERIRGWSPTRQVPVNPTTGDPGSAVDDQTPIVDPASRLWANLFNLRYRMLLTYLTHAYRLTPATPRPEQPILRGPVIHRAFGEMYNLKAIAAQLVDLPLGNTRSRRARGWRRKSPERAGPTFEMPYTLTLPDAEIDCWRLHRDLVVASRDLCAKLAPQASADGARYLATLGDLDRQALDWIDRILTGHPARRHSA
jgi:hypothetical protein